MQPTKAYLINLINTDPVLSALSVQAVIGGVDAIERYPTVTIEDTSARSELTPLGVRILNFDITAWTNTSGYDTDTIYERLWAILNYLQFTTTGGTKVYYTQEIGGTSNIDLERTIWSKKITLKVWVK